MPSSLPLALRGSGPVSFSPSSTSSTPEPSASSCRPCTCSIPTYEPAAVNAGKDGQRAFYPTGILSKGAMRDVEMHLSVLDCSLPQGHPRRGYTAPSRPSPVLCFGLVKCTRAWNHGRTILISSKMHARLERPELTIDGRPEGKRVMSTYDGLRELGAQPFRFNRQSQYVLEVGNQALVRFLPPVCPRSCLSALPCPAWVRR